MAQGNRCVNIIIRDTGIGIAEEDLEQIFIPFYSTKKGGSGIWSQYITTNHAKAKR